MFVLHIDFDLKTVFGAPCSALITQESVHQCALAFIGLVRFSESLLYKRSDLFGLCLACCHCCCLCCRFLSRGQLQTRVTIQVRASAHQQTQPGSHVNMIAALLSRPLNNSTGGMRGAGLTLACWKAYTGMATGFLQCYHDLHAVTLMGISRHYLHGMLQHKLQSCSDFQHPFHLLVLYAASATQTVYVWPPPPVLGCPGNPSAPDNASDFDCEATGPGGNCSTVCKNGYTLVEGNLTAACSSDDVPVWSEVSGRCSPASKLHGFLHYFGLAAFTSMHNSHVSFSLCHSVCLSVCLCLSACQDTNLSCRPCNTRC
jgi:hypothetical protein